MCQESSPIYPLWRNAVCEDCCAFLNAYRDAVREVVRLNEEQFQALLAGDLDAHRFDLLIHSAMEAKQNAKYAFLLLWRSTRAYRHEIIDEHGTGTRIG